MANLTTILPPAVTSTFRGYYQREDASWETMGCASTEAFYSLRQFGLCCATDEPDCRTAMVTSCDGVHPVATGTYTCGENQACRTLLIYDQFPMTAAGTARTNIVCAEPGFSVGVLYRTVITQVAETGTASVSLTSTSSITTASNTSSASASTSAAGSSNSSGSKAWLAGAVIGPVLAAGLIGALLFWIFRLRRRIRHYDQAPDYNMPSHEPPRHEVEAFQAKVEAPGYQHKVSELPLTANAAELPAPIR